MIINERNITDYVVSKKLMNDTKKIYTKLKSILDSSKIDKLKIVPGRDKDYQKVDAVVELVKKAYKEVGGQVYPNVQSMTYVVFDGKVKSYTLYNSVSLKSYTAGDMNRIAEDLTMAYFRTHGGNCNNTMDLISYIKTGHTEYGSNFILESLNDDIKRYEAGLDNESKFLKELDKVSSKNEIQRLLNKYKMPKWHLKTIDKFSDLESAKNEIKKDINQEIEFYTRDLNNMKSKQKKIPGLVKEIHRAVPNSSVSGNKIICKTSDDLHDYMYDVAKMLISKIGIKSDGTDLVHKGSWTALSARKDDIRIKIDSNGTRGAVTVTVQD